MRADFKVVLDACVLAPANLCELLLRLAETPRLYLPRWSRETLDEVHRTQIQKLGFPPELADSWEAEVGKSFPQAQVVGYEPLIAILKNDPEDRHVLAAAVRSGAEVIVTSNLKHFPYPALDNWGITAHHPSDFLINLYSMNSATVVSKIDAIARDRNYTPEEYLKQLAKVVRAFSEYVANDLEWDI